MLRAVEGPTTSNYRGPKHVTSRWTDGQASVDTCTCRQAVELMLLSVHAHFYKHVCVYVYVYVYVYIYIYIYGNPPPIDPHFSICLI